MLLKKTTVPSSILRTLDTNQGDEALIREARNQKRKTNCLDPREEELDEEINNLEVIHHQIEKRKEKMLRLSELQRKIDEAAEEMPNIEAHNNKFNKNQEHDNLRKEEFNFQDFLYDEASPLTPELQATP
jgi:ABC-type Fe3+-citrate transport system substrate-binding protein